VKTGDTLELICEHDDPFSLQWHRAPAYHSSHNSSNSVHYHFLDTSSQSGFYMTSLVKDGRGWTNLTKYNVSISDAGSYKCSMISKPDRSYAVDVHVLQAEEISAVIARAGANAVIGCIVNSPDRIRVNVSWSKYGRLIASDLHQYDIKLNQTDTATTSLLNITRVGDRDIGQYECVITLGNGLKLSQPVNLYTYPQVRPMGRSRNLVAGKVLKLECHIWGWPVPQVSWNKLGPSASRIPLNWSDPRLTVLPGMAVAPFRYSVDNATLIIRDVTYTDRDTYVCDVTSYVDHMWRTDNGTVLVRVKDKFAPVWPLLGIVAEAVILCVIIILHEGNRLQHRDDIEFKDADNHLHDNSSTAQSSHRHDQQHHQVQDDNLIRHRK
jgi:hypothetical protein